MAALSAAVQRRYRSIYSYVQNWRVANADTLYIGSYCCIPGAQALTSRRGYLTTFRNEQNVQWAGILIGSPGGSGASGLSTSNTVVGDTSASPVVEGSTEAGPYVGEQLAVTGVSAQTDVRQPVYASNDNDLTLTANQAPIVGRVVYWYSSTTADVLFYGYLASVVI